MTSLLSPQANALLQASLPIVDAHRSLIVAGMTRILHAADSARGKAWAVRAAASIVDMLIEQARHFATGLGPQDLHRIRLDHLRNDIGRLHYARFADAIAPVMVDAVGSTLPKPVGSAWCDAFWAVIGRMRQQDANAIAVETRPVETGSHDALAVS